MEGFVLTFTNRVFNPRELIYSLDLSTWRYRTPRCAQYGTQSCCDEYPCVQLVIFLCSHSLWTPAEGMISFQDDFQSHPHVSKFPTMSFIVSSVSNAPFSPSIHAPDLLQTIRNLWTLTLLMLLSVQTKTISIRLSFIGLDMQILCNYAKAVLLRISYFCFL